MAQCQHVDFKKIKKFPPDDIPFTAEVFEPTGRFSGVQDSVPLLFTGTLGILSTMQLSQETAHSLTLFFAALLLACHNRLSRSVLVRLLVGAALGLGISTLGIMLFICKLSISVLPDQAKTVVKWVAFIATLFGMGSVELYTEGLQQYVRLVLLRTKFFVLAFWEYQWTPGPKSFLSLYGTVTTIPMGKIFFVVSMVAGVLAVLYMRWFEARDCQECGEKVVDIECEDCLKGRENSRVCSSCHHVQDPLDRHVNAHRVSHVGQRLLSVLLFLSGVYLVLFPDYSGKKVALLLCLLTIFKGKVLQWLWHRLWLVSGSEAPHRQRFLSRTECDQQARETTQRELEKLRQLYRQYPDRDKLSEAASREVEKFVHYEEYNPLPKEEERRRHSRFILASMLVAAMAVACALPLAQMAMVKTSPQRLPALPHLMMSRLLTIWQPAGKESSQAVDKSPTRNPQEEQEA